MRKRFEQQLSIGQLPIEDTELSLKDKTSLNELLAALKAIYSNKEYNEKVFRLLENSITAGKKKTGRKGMDLWVIFVLSQVRLCQNASYHELHSLANNHLSMRKIMGVEYDFGYARVDFEYQNIYDNISLLSDDLIKGINSVVLEFGHSQVFKKKATALRLKTDSFVVQSNVHFPTDYNLLWDCARKCLDTVSKFLVKYEHLKGWRKIANWRYELKGLMREVGKASSSGGKNKQDRITAATKRYTSKAEILLKKLKEDLPLFPATEPTDLALIMQLEYFIILLEKHIGLVDRRILKGEQIPHEEKIFSIFETYTEFIKKGKMRPNVELGKKLSITTDQFDLIVDYQIMENEQDRDIVKELGKRLLSKYPIFSWSFDKGYWRKENKEFLQDQVQKVIMPKLGKRNKSEESEESSRTFKGLKNKHSAIESNINELEHRGLDRCPDRGLLNYRRYISLGISAYNLKKMGREILRQEKAKKEKEILDKLKSAA